MRTHNCFTKDTTFITDTGIKSFSDFTDGDEVMVLTHLGNWKKAVVHNYGKQSVRSITFVSNSGDVKQVTATKDHCWVLKDGKETQTLFVGDTLFPTPSISHAAAKGQYCAIFSSSERPLIWTVESMEPAGEEDVWCLEVEDDHSFVLEDGIPTGNCSEHVPRKRATLARGIMVETTDGNVAIEYLRPDDIVYTWDAFNKRINTSAIRSVTRINRDTHVMKIKLSNGTSIVCSSDQMIGVMIPDINSRTGKFTGTKSVRYMHARDVVQNDAVAVFGVDGVIAESDVAFTRRMRETCDIFDIQLRNGSCLFVNNNNNDGAALVKC